MILVMMSISIVIQTLVIAIIIGVMMITDTSIMLVRVKGRVKGIPGGAARGAGGGQTRKRHHL